MRFTAILVVLLAASSALVQAQTRAQNQEKLVQFLTTDLKLTPDQTVRVRGFIQEADNVMAQSEMQYFSTPERLPHVRKQILMDLGKKVETILTPAQLAQYPKTKQKLYDRMQARYKGGITKESQQEAKPKEMQPAEPREVK